MDKKIFIAQPGVMVANSRFQDIARQLPESSFDLVVADWPFNKGNIDLVHKRIISDGIKHASRLLKPNGSIVSIHYLEPNFNVWKECEYWGLRLGDSITILRHPIKKVKHRLAYETLSILVFFKGQIEERTLNTTCRTKGGNLIYSKKEWGITSDFWDQRKFKNGYYRKGIGDRVAEAMPESYVQEILRTYTPVNGMVLDLFGGAGTVPLVCNRLGFKCISTEVQPHRFQIINRRLLETNQELIRFSKDLLHKALEVLDKAGSYTKGDESWQRKRAEEKEAEPIQQGRTNMQEEA